MNRLKPFKLNIRLGCHRFSMTLIACLLLVLTVSKAQVKPVQHPQIQAELELENRLLEGDSLTAEKWMAKCAEIHFLNQSFPLDSKGFKLGMKAKYASLSRLNEGLNLLGQVPNEWEELGPSSWPDCQQDCFAQGIGRLDYILLDSLNDRIFVCSPAGGTFVSYDHGLNFVNAGTDQLPVIGASCIQVDPNHPDTWYVASGEADGQTYDVSMGVYRTMDGGKSWMAINQTQTGEKLETNLNYAWNPLKIRELLVHPEDGNRIWAATNRGLYYCNNARSPEPLWQKLAEGAFYDLEFQFGRADTVFAGGDDLFISTNEGRTFSRNNPPDEAQERPQTGYERMVVRSSLADRKVYAFRLKHENGNKPAKVYEFIPKTLAWKLHTIYEDRRYAQAGDGHLNPGRGQGIAISPSNPNLWFAGNIPLRRSIDGGITWTYLRGLHPDMHYLTFSADGKEIWSANDGGLYVSTDQGESWEVRSNGIGVATLYYLDVSDRKPENIAYGAQDTGGLIRWNNKKWTLYLGGDGQGCAFHPTDSNIVYLSESPNGRKVFRTQNSGYSWRPVLSGNRLGSIYYSDVSVTQAYPDAVYQPGSGVNQSLNRGNTWRQIGKWDNRQCMEVFPHHINKHVVFTRVYDNTQGKWKHELLKTKNALAGKDSIEWERIDLPVNMGFRLSLNDDPDAFYVGFQGYSDAQVKVGYYNGSWLEDKTYNLGHRPVFDIVHLKSEWGDWLFAGTDQGVYHLPPGDTLWENFGNSPRVRVHDLELDLTGNTLVAGTFGRGVWRISLPETGWIPVQRSVVIDVDCFAHGNLVVKPGVKMVLNANLYLPEGKGIRVDPGGELDLRKGSVENADGRHWNGILVGTRNPPKWLRWLLPIKQGKVIYGFMPN